MSDTDVCTACHKPLTIEHTIYARNNGLCRDCYEDEVIRECRFEPPKVHDRTLAAPIANQLPRTRTGWLKWAHNLADESD